MINPPNRQYALPENRLLQLPLEQSMKIELTLWCFPMEHLSILRVLRTGSFSSMEHLYILVVLRTARIGGHYVYYSPLVLTHSTSLYSQKCSKQVRSQRVHV